MFSGFSGFLHQYNWPPRYNRNIVESGVKHHQAENKQQKKTIIVIKESLKLPKQ